MSPAGLFQFKSQLLLILLAGLVGWVQGDLAWGLVLVLSPLLPGRIQTASGDRPGAGVDLGASRCGGDGRCQR